MDFNDDPNEVKNLISSINASGGGDTCEDLLGALETGLGFRFEYTNITNVILITDAPCHGT